MDYFSELLESYDKLKKRTFKLTYLTEAKDKKKKKEEKPEPKTDAATMQKAQQVADAAINDAPSIASQEITTNGLKVNNVLGEPTGLTIYRNINNGSVGVQGLGPHGGILSIDRFDTQTKTVQRVPDAYNKFVEKLAGESELTNTSKTSLEQDQEQQEQEKLLAQQAEMERLAKLEHLGGAFELAGRNPEDLKVILTHLVRSEKSLIDFCSNLDPKNMEGSLKNLCGRPAAYLGGASKSGLEYKLSKGQAITVDPETGKQTGVGPLEIGLLQAVTESHAALTNFLTGEGDCETITSKVGFYKDRLVLFGDSSTEGVTIKPNALQFAAIDRLNQDCDDPDLTEVISDTLSPNEINAVKGTFNELILQTGIRLLASTNNKERKAAFREIAEEIGRKRQFLTSYAATQETKDDVALGLDESFDNDILLEQAGIAQDNIALRDWFLNELSMQLSFVRSVQADGVIPAGRDVITGDRTDTLLTYNDEARAQAAANLIGSSAQPQEDGSWSVGMGQKRLQEIHKVKIGEINTTSRMIDIFSEKVTQDKNLAPGFLNTIQSMQFGDDTSRLEAAKEFMGGVEDKVEKATASLSDYATYLDADGKIKSVKPEARLKTVADSIKGLLSFDDLSKSALGKALFKGSGDYRDYGDTSTQQRTQEVVRREARFKSLKDEIDIGNQAAQDSLVRMALICGANVTSMSQLITEDSGESYVISHNAALEAVAQANSAGTLVVNIKGTTAILTTPDGISISFSQEGQWGAGKRLTRSLTKIDKATVEKLNLQINTQEESTLYKFLEGQMKLLENILNQSKRSQAL